jgi:hypothetical protein
VTDNALLLKKPTAISLVPESGKVKNCRYTGGSSSTSETKPY